MPWFIRGKCVIKGTKESPGDTIKCHESKAKATAHMRALYANVEDAVLKAFGIAPMTGTLRVYKDGGQDRWIAESTAELWDRQKELFTVHAMDYDIAHVLKSGEYPELRMFHVRGFKLGQCDSMERIGIRAVDQGWWHDTPFAQAVKDLVIADTQNKLRISRGFSPIQATGLCPDCGAGLKVGLVNHIFGVRCACGAYHPKVQQLKQLRHTKAKTFDISVTDVPVLSSTAIAAYTVAPT